MMEMNDVKDINHSSYKVLGSSPSDSSNEVVEFSQPLVRPGGGPRRKRRRKKSHRTATPTPPSSPQSSYCLGPPHCRSLCLFLSHIFYLLSILSLIFSTYHMRSQMGTLDEFYTSGKASGDTYFKSLTEVKKNLNDLKNLSKNLTSNSNSENIRINEIMRQIALLNASTVSIQASLAAAPEIKALPAAVKDLQQLVADQGVEVSQLKSRLEVEEKAREKYESILNQSKELNREMPSSTFNTQPNLTQTIITMNSTIWDRFFKIDDIFRVQQKHISDLMNKTDLLKSSYQQTNSSEILKLLEAQKEGVENVTLTILSMREEIDSISKTHQSLMQDHGNNNNITHPT